METEMETIMRTNMETKLRTMMESMIETNNRFESYQTEIQAISQLGISFHEWLQLIPSTEVITPLFTSALDTAQNIPKSLDQHTLFQGFTVGVV